MAVPLAYLGVILIWGTTPLSIKWSSDGVGYLFGVTGRMIIGVLLALLVSRLMGLRLSWHRQARQTYLAAGLGIYLAMSGVYWASQYIPSGWISVVFATAPIVTGLMARLWLTERGLTPLRLLAMLVSLSGLALIFATGAEGGLPMILGVIGVLFSVLVHSASAVWIKRLDAGLHGLVVTTGGLLIAVPLFVLTWLVQDHTWPAVISARTALSIVYLGIVGSVLGFALYYYVLKHVETVRVSLITLVTPVMALMVGHWFNAEQIEGRVWFGTLLISLGLLGFELASRISFGLRPKASAGEEL